MAKRKRRTTKKNATVTHSLPEGFWRQTAGIIAAIIALLILLAMFGVGGPLPHALLTAARWLIGVVAFMLPLILVYYVVELFRAEQNRLPLSMKFAMVVFLSALAGLMQLWSDYPSSITYASGGDGGGVIGFGIVKLLLSALDTAASTVVLLFIALVSVLFVLKIPLKSVFMAIGNLFTRENFDSANKVIGQKVGDLKIDRKTNDVAELKLNQGVPLESSELEKPSRLSSFRNSAEPLTKQEENTSALTIAADPNWEFPSLDLLEKKQKPADAGDVKGNAQIIKDTLGEFNIGVEMEGANIGPKVTQYTLKPPAGVKLTRITALETNIALNLAAQAIRIEAPIPGQRAVGIEVPNRRAADVRLFGVLDSRNWKNNDSPLGFAVGKDIAGEAVVGELNKMPHLLIAGQTGSGKSVMINTLLTSLLYRNSPSNMKLILVDPKQVEMAPYEDIPHLLTPIITEPEKCISALKWAVNEMERRYSLLAEKKLRDIKSYNERKDTEGMPYIVIVIDELADLMMIAARDVEALIVRLAQKARAVGIHLVLATQRPSVDVITGLIKANVPARIAFTVASQVDSRTILDQVGAEKLLGQGDMLMLTPAMSKPKRIQGAWVMDEEVLKITDYLRMQRPPEYDDEIIAQPVQLGGGKGGIVMDYDGGGDDDMYKEAVRVVAESGKASASLLQRRLRVGYARAARLIETMEEQGIIGPADGARPREVLISNPEDAFQQPE